MVKSGTTAAFKYNNEGLRVQKTVNGTVTNYTLHGKNIVHMTQGGNTLHFWYDASNRPAIVQFNGTRYAYIHNLQGDIVGIVDTNGNEAVKYTYDAWGKVLAATGSLASTLGNIQPFRYRGYVYDVETGLYYLRSRYYNPIWQRFVNADSYISATGELSRGNCWSYCGNNSISFSDPNGHWFGIDDVITGPVDEIVVLGMLAIGSLLGIEPAKKALSQLTNVFSAPRNTAKSDDSNVPSVEVSITQQGSYQTLIESLIQSKQKAISTNKQPKKQTNEHHIVAQNDFRASGAAEILNGLHINVVTDPDNIVTVSTEMHWCLHTGVYHATVSEIVFWANSLQGNQENNVRTALRMIKFAITVIDNSTY